jgi:UDP-N-acetylglucosamine 2-epimerase (non-hydrolysing)/GDP/UDP-N,N'-diacetylbacillosamine 2-epimerase (hydrolysing)
MPLKVCAVTGSRAEYGLLQPVLKAIDAEPSLALDIVVTGMHLAPEYGQTWQAIEKDGFRIAERVEALVASDSAQGTAKSIGLGVIGFADAYARLRPDLVLLLGDRFEIFAAAQAALVSLVPIAHIAGGDTTEGAYDEGFRHAITKMAHLHFATNAESARRLRQMGENPQHVHDVGSPAIDAIKRTPLLGRAELEERLGLRLRARNLLVTFHPATLDGGANRQHLQALLDALDGLGADVGLIFTYPNADTGARELAAMVERFVAGHPNASGFVSLGQQLYWSCMKACDAVVGNSSSGIYEAPYLRVPAVDVGDRQKGRHRAASVISCPPEAGAIAAAVRSAWAGDWSAVKNPYGDGESAARIVAVLKSLPDPRRLLKKRFFDDGDHG